MDAEKTIETTRKIISGGILAILVGTTGIAIAGQFKAKKTTESIYSGSANLVNVAQGEIKEIKLDSVEEKKEYKLDPFIKLAQSHCNYYGGSEELCNDLDEMIIRAEGLKKQWEQEYAYCIEQVLGTMCTDAGSYINKKINPPLKWRNNYQWSKVEETRNTRLLGLF